MKSNLVSKPTSKIQINKGEIKAALRDNGGSCGEVLNSWIRSDLIKSCSAIFQDSIAFVIL